MAVTNKVPNSIDKSEWQGDYGYGDYWELLLTAKSGYKFDGEIKAAYTDIDGNPCTVVLQPRNSSNLEVRANVYDTDADTAFVITGNTRLDNELAVTNNIPNTSATGVKVGAYGGSVTVTANEGFIITGAKIAFTDVDGNFAKVDMTISADGKTASWSNDDFQRDYDITLTGTTASAAPPAPTEIPVTANLSNCYADPPLPETLQVGATLNVTIKANENTAFDTAQSTPKFSYYDDGGNPTNKDLTVSSDKKTATGSLTLQDGWGELSVNAQAYPVAVVGQQYGAINVYLVTLDELAEFSGKRFFKETETGTQNYENIDLGAYVNRIRRVYTNISAGSGDVIRCGNYNTGVSCQQPAQDKITLDFGTVVVPAHNEDNTDYESEIQIFLPFAGFVNLNTDYAGKTIGLQYVINVVTGNGVALLSCNGIVFQVEEIEPSSEIIYLSPSDQVKTVGGDDWNEMLYYGVEPYIYCKWYESASNGLNKDRKTGILGDFRGFNIFDDVTPIHTAEMLTEEQEMIYTALSDGVYIE